jgi:HTH-type transcriptional regulator/antitoxin HipB
MAWRFSGPLGADPESDRLASDQKYPDLLGGKSPTLQIGEKPPKMFLSGKALKNLFAATGQRTTMQTIARTPLQPANSIRQRRRELGLTEVQLAAKAGVRQRTISDMERSAARSDTVLRALAALDLELGHRCCQSHRSSASSFGTCTDRDRQLSRTTLTAILVFLRIAALRCAIFEVIPSG